MKLLLALLVATAVAEEAITVEHSSYRPTQTSTQHSVSCTGIDNGHLTEITHGQCKLELRAVGTDHSNNPDTSQGIYTKNVQTNANLDGFFEIQWNDNLANGGRDCDNDIKVKVDWDVTQHNNNQLDVYVSASKLATSAGHHISGGYEYKQYWNGQEISDGWTKVYHRGSNVGFDSDTFQWSASQHPCRGCGVTCELSADSGLIEVLHNTDALGHDRSLDKHMCYINDEGDCQCECRNSHIPTGCVDDTCSSCLPGYTHDAAQDHFDGSKLVCHLITAAPTAAPSASPTAAPTAAPSASPTAAPTPGTCETHTCSSGYVRDEIDIKITVNTGHWANEMMWKIDGHPVIGRLGQHGTDEIYKNWRTYVWHGELAPGTHTLSKYDTWGDGWNGGKLDITVHSTQLGWSQDVTLVDDATLAWGREGTQSFTVPYHKCSGGCSDSQCCEATLAPTQAPTRHPCAVDIRVDLNTRIWANEIRWAIDGHSEVGSLGHHGKSSPYQNYRTYRWVGEIQPGTHKLNMHDTYGDGWHGATIWVKNHNSGAQYLKHTWDWYSGDRRNQAKYFNIPSSC